MKSPKHIVVKPNHDRPLEFIRRASCAKDRSPRLDISMSRSPQRYGIAILSYSSVLIDPYLASEISVWQPGSHGVRSFAFVVSQRSAAATCTCHSVA